MYVYVREYAQCTSTYVLTHCCAERRLHSESKYAAYFDDIEVIGPCAKVGSEILVNAELKGKIVDGTVAGWNTHNTKLTKVTWKGRKDVLRNQDGGGFSEVYKSVNTVVGMTYHITCE